MPVKIGETVFTSKRAAVEYFMARRKAVKETGLLREGDFFEELRDLYTRSGELTGRDPGNRVIHAFSVDYEPRQTDQTWAPHLCYWVQFSAEEKLSFSVKEAVDAIANAAAAEHQE